MTKKIFLLFVVVANLTFTNSIFGQEIGTYRSAVANGAWTTPTSWQFYNGTSWITPIAYPGQLFSATESVFIQQGHTITMGPTPLTTVSPFWDLTINGKLIMEGESNSFVEFKLATKKIVVTENLIPAATIEFVKKTQLKLPENATITVGNDGFTGSCTNNNEIWIGGVIYSICTGGNQEINFDEIIALGGTGNADANSPVCIGNQINFYATPPPNGDTYSFSWTGPNNFTSIAQNPIISNAQSVNGGEYTVLMTYLNNTITAKTTVEVSNGTAPPAPTIGTITSSCSSTSGSVELTGLPSPGLWKLVTNPGGDEVYGTGTTKVITGLPIGAYTFEVSYYTSIAPITESCTSFPSAQVSILAVNNSWLIAAVDSNWNNAANWECGVPSINSAVVIYPGAFQPEISSNVEVNTIIIESGAALKIKSGANLTITGGIGNEGTITIENNANLVQTGANNNNSGSGNVIVKRESNDLFRLDYTMWSSPVTGSQTLLNFSPLTYPTRFYTYNSSTNLYTSVNPSTTTFSKGIGYLIRMPNTDPTPGYDSGNSAVTYKGEFTGQLNNALVTLSGLTSGSFYAIGNPYPSTIYADAFNIENGSATTGTFYFWRKKNNTSTDSYATYTKFVGLASPGDLNGIVPNGIIQVGQGFIVQLKLDTTIPQLLFKNYMRTENNNNQILRSNIVNKHRIWLNLTNVSTPVNQMVVGYMSGATMDVDYEIDGAYINDSQTALTSLINNEEYIIQARGLPFNDTDVFPLAFKTTINGNFTISIDHIDGLFSGNQVIILVDNITGIETNLKTNSYTFATNAGVYNSRFYLKFQINLGNNPVGSDQKNIVVYKEKEEIHIKSTTSIENIKVYDILGRLILEKMNINTNETSIVCPKFANQVLIVKITLQDNIVVSKKVMN